MTAGLVAALRRLARRPLRTILTILEVALGALAVTLALNLTQGRQLAALPPDVFRVVTGDRSETTAASYNIFQVGDLEKLRKLIPDAEVVEFYVNQSGAIFEYAGERFKLQGGARVGPQYNRIVPLEMLQGAFFNNKDVQSGTPPIVISQGIATELFKNGNPLGKTVQFANGYNPTNSSPSFETYRVIGVFRDPASAGFEADHAFVPFLRTFGTLEGFSALSIKARAGRSEIAQAQAIEAVRQVYKDNSLFNQFKKPVYVTSSTNFNQVAPGPDPQAILFSSFAMIMLITCSIGIFSIQLVDITERTKEIGMRRALGATRSVIVLESLASAFVLAGSGAIIGVMIAAPLLPIIKNATGPFLFSRGLEFSPIVALQVVGIVLVVGVLLGFYPALLASRLKPVEALREM